MISLGVGISSTLAAALGFMLESGSPIAVRVHEEALCNTALR
jgi:hypothetical protein